MSNLPLGEDLKTLFADVTSGEGEHDDVRAILVQNDNGMLRLVNALPKEGTDKDDFETVLGKLFANEPQRSGYALFRLDSKSPAGLSEWINCAYRPEGAKVREKMQYAVTQASLFAGLSEQHFLDTVYGANAKDFAFPTSLRNARKHDYQNPQIVAKGKPAAELAGSGTGGARRNFGARTPAAAAATAASSGGTGSEGRPAFPGSMTEDGTRKQTTTVDSMSSPAAEEKPPVGDVVADESAAMSMRDEPPPPTEMNAAEPEVDTSMSSPPRPPEETLKIEQPATGEVELAQAIAIGEGVDADAGKALQQGDDAKVTPFSASPTAIERVERAASGPGALCKASAAAEEPVSAAAPVSEEDTVGSIAPSADPRLSKAASTDDNVGASASTRSAAAPTQTSSVSGPSSSIGTGQGAKGLETERERQLAELKNTESRTRASAAGQAGTGGPNAGMAWDGDVEPALRGLAKKGATASTAEWNFVALRLDLSRELLQLAFPPRMAMPGDIASALTEASSGEGDAENTPEPCYAFYAHPQPQSDDDGATRVGLVYVCPMHSTVRQRMIYSSNLASVASHVGSFPGLDIVKRVETSDPEDITPEYLVEVFVPSTADDDALATEPAGGAAAFSRPKRPGRK